MAKKIGKGVANLLGKALVTSIGAMLVAFILSFILGFAEGIPYFTMIYSLLVIGVLVMLKPKIKFDSYSFYDTVVFLLAIGFFGSLLTGLVPDISTYIISVESFTLSGLASTMMYIGLAEALFQKLKI